MLSWYQDEENGLWYVTYQRNAHSEIVTLYKGDSEEEAMAIVDKFIEEWG